MQRHLYLVLMLSVVAACGEPEEPADTTSCSELRPIRLGGEVGELSAVFTRANDSLGVEQDVGQLTSRRITLFLGEVEFTPAGGVPGMRPRIMTIQTNTEGQIPLQETIDERRRGFGNEFDVIDKPEDTYCDPTEGELCVRFGLDNTENNELIADTIIHTGQSGSVVLC